MPATANFMKRLKKRGLAVPSLALQCPFFSLMQVVLSEMRLPGQVRLCFSSLLFFKDTASIRSDISGRRYLLKTNKIVL